MGQWVPMGSVGPNGVNVVLVHPNRVNGSQWGQWGHGLSQWGQWVPMGSVGPNGGVLGWDMGGDVGLTSL